MLPAERRERILNALQATRFLSVAQLARRTGSSESTIRRDLAELEREGLIVRTRGGAGIATGAGGFSGEMSKDARSQHRAEQKAAIGRAAARLVEDVGTVILDAGTTTLEVARALNPSQKLRVVTDSLDIAWELRDRENVTVILSGGILRKGAYNLYGSMAEQAMAGLHAQLCVMGCSGLTLEEGLTKHDIEAEFVRKRMVEASQRLVVVADSSKLGVTGLVSICALEEIDVLVTDKEIPAEFQQMLEEHGIQVIIADE